MAEMLRLAATVGVLWSQINCGGGFVKPQAKYRGAGPPRPALHAVRQRKQHAGTGLIEVRNR